MTRTIFSIEGNVFTAHSMSTFSPTIAFWNALLDILGGPLTETLTDF